MELQKKHIQGIFKSITEHSVFAITTHSNPDGDAVGSSVALSLILQAMGKTVSVVMPNDCPDFLKWIHGYNEIVLFDTQTEKAKHILEEADVIFCLDYNCTARIEDMGKVIENSGKPLILIDHHPYPQCDAEYMISETSACSTAELVYRVVHECGLQNYINQHIAEALYTGIITDTGGLVHNSNDPELYHIVADLLSHNISKQYIHEQIFHVYSYERMKLMGLVLKDNFVFLPEYNAAYMYISIQNQKEHNFQVGDSEGIVNLPLSVKGICFCALFTEYPNKTIKVSFRSKGTFPANKFSGDFFNGGGHLNAAGGRQNCTLQEAIDIFKQGLGAYKDLLNA